MKPEEITKELARFNITDTAIAEMSNRYMALTITGINDKAGLDAVHRARMTVKTKRVEVQKTGKALREEANAYLKVVLTEEKRILTMLEPIEDHLQDEESRVTEELARLKAEAEAAITAKITGRHNLLFKMGCSLLDGNTFSYSGVAVAEKNKVATATDEQFAALVQTIQDALDEEVAERAKAEAEKKAEEERLAKVATEQAAEKKRLEAEQARIKKEQDAKEKELVEAQAKLKEQQAELAAAKQKLIDDEAARLKAIADEKARVEQEKVRAAELEAAKKAAAEKALADAEAKAARDKAEAEAKAERARLAAARKAARRPDKEKLTLYVETFNAIPKPELKTEDGLAVQAKIDELLSETVVAIETWIGEL